MNIYFCESSYESRLTCDFEWNRFQHPQVVKASDFVLAEDRQQAARLFSSHHQGKLSLENVKVEYRATLDPSHWLDLTLIENVRPVGDIALYDYWEWLHRVGSVAA